MLPAHMIALIPVHWWSRLIKQLAKQSATVICASRNIELAKELGAQISKETSNNNIHNLLLELDSLDSVRDFIKVFNKF